MKMLERRYRASSVRLDHPRSYESTAWIVGGYGSKNSTTTTGTLYLDQTSLFIDLICQRNFRMTLPWLKYLSKHRPADQLPPT